MSADERRFEVLRAIVTDYVATNEPVGSKTLVDRYRLGVSSATIRNDMAVLEDEGYIAQPHTSAGRVPTDKGYRLFVDQLSQLKPLSVGERRAIQTFLEQGTDLDDVLHRSARLLAQLTHQVAVVQYPRLTRAVVRHVELVALTAHRLLLVMITDTGRVEQRVVDLADPASVELVARLRSRLAGQITGCPVTQAGPTIADFVAVSDAQDQPVARAVADVLADVLVEDHDERLVLSGTAHMADAFAEQAAFRGLLEALDEQVTLLKLLAVLQSPEAVMVSIGQENHVENLSGSALVSTGYGPGEVVIGGLAVVGPTRMNYPQTMAAVRAVARYVGEIVAAR